MADETENLATSYSPDNFWENSGLFGQTFTASTTGTMTQAKIWVWQNNTENGSNEMYVCEVPSINTTSGYVNHGTPIWDYCSDTPVEGTLDSRPEAGNAGYQVFNFDYSVETGHYYMIFPESTAYPNDVFHIGYKLASSYDQGGWCYSSSGDCAKASGGEDNQFQIYVDSAPTVSGTVYWAGVGSIFGRLGGQWYVPIHYDVCASYDDINDLTASTDMDGEGNPSVEIIHDKTTFIGPQACRGTAFMVGSVLATSDQTGTTTIQLITNADGVIATSSVYNYQINNGAPTAYIDNSIISPLKIDFNSSSTTTLPFSYDLTGLDWSGGQICVYNKDASIKTDYCVSITATSGLAYMDFPNPPSSYILNGSYRFYNSGGNVLLESDPFQLVWYGAYVSGLSDLLGTSTAAMVCTPAEWASSDWWTQIRCSTFKTGLDIADKISHIVSVAVSGLIWLIGKLFPFSVAADFYNSWQASETTALPAELDWLNIVDSTGNLHLAFPAQWVGGSTSTDYVIFGPDVFTPSGSRLADFFAGIKVLSKYLMWAGFIFALWRFAHDLYEDLKE